MAGEQMTEREAALAARIKELEGAIEGHGFASRRYLT
jgi:hypothetical protein